MVRSVGQMRMKLVLLLLLVLLQPSECVQCYARVDVSSGECEDELGEVDDEDDCCQNPHYGYQGPEGQCQSCGPPQWSEWSPWSPCTVLCGEGVKQRSRRCVGQGECEGREDTLQTTPCNTTCCDGLAWGPWVSSPCSVTCGGGGGVKTKERTCLAVPECRSACSGPDQERESCSTHTPCPVSGGWSSWSDWTRCSGSCVPIGAGNISPPFRERRRSCSSPVPSVDTTPPGRSCKGDATQVQDCSELPNCSVDGGWGAWPPPGPCSVSCGEGLQLSVRRCDSPAPKYGGRQCQGPSTKSSVCQAPCPVDGSWTGWSPWSDCSTACLLEDHASVRTRRRSCSNPAPTVSGQNCPGHGSESEQCHHLPHCAVHGTWGPWGSFSSCSVTCGVGLRLSIRRCDSPAPKHGGKQCPGSGRRSITCTTNVHCPVDGVWGSWSSWSSCENLSSSRKIRCSKRGGSQTQQRNCLYQAHNGAACEGDKVIDTRVCYDITDCPMQGSWSSWSSWSMCSPPCGPNSRRSRTKTCEPDLSAYRATVGHQRELANFYGTPQMNCSLLPEEQVADEKPCLHVPSCP